MKIELPSAHDRDRSRSSAPSGRTPSAIGAPRPRRPLEDGLGQLVQVYHGDARSDPVSVAKVQLRTACEHLSRAESCCNQAIRVAQTACAAFQQEHTSICDARASVERILRHLD